MEDDSQIRLTTKDEEKARQSLERYRLVLKLNMIPCEEFLQILVRCGIFSECIVQSIAKLPAREEKNCKILDLVSIYGGSAVLKFCDALHLSGHTYLSDLLYSSLQNLISPDLSPLPLPKLNSKTMTPQDVAQLSAYIEQAIKEGVMREMWEGGSREKERTVSTRQKYLEDGLKLVDQQKDRDHRLDETKKQLKQVENEVEALRQEVERLSRQLKEERTMHREDLTKQATFCQSQERTLQRMTQRLQEVDKAIEDMFLSMVSFVEREDEKMTDSRLPKEKLYRETSITFLDKLRDVLQHVMTKYEATMRVRVHYERLQSERDFMLHFLDISCGEDNFKEAFRAYVSRNEETSNRLREKAKKLQTQLQNSKNDQEFAENQLSGAFQEMDSLKVALKVKDAQIRKLMQDRSQFKNELMAMRKPALATVVSNLFKKTKNMRTAEKATPNPSEVGSKGSNPNTVSERASTWDNSEADRSLTAESDDDLRRMLDEYYSPSSAAANSSSDPCPSRITKLHIVLPKDDGYLQQHTGGQPSGHLPSLLDSKEILDDVSEALSPRNGFKPGIDIAPEYLPVAQDVKAWDDSTNQNESKSQGQGNGRTSEFNETLSPEKEKSSRHLVTDITECSRRHNLGSGFNARESVVSGGRNNMGFYVESNFHHQQQMKASGKNSTKENDVIATRNDVVVAKRVVQNDVIASRSDILVSKIDVGMRVTGKESSAKNREAARLAGTSTPEIISSHSAEPIQLRHIDVTGTECCQNSTEGVFPRAKRSTTPRLCPVLDCNIRHVTSGQYYDNQTASATYRWTYFGGSGKPRAVVCTKCLNCSGVEKVVRSRAGLRSAGASCDHHQQRLHPSYTRNKSNTHVPLTAPKKTYDATELLKITRLDRK